MADIVQLEEKGNLLYPKTHTSAIDGLDETLVKKTGDEDIAGVKNFTDGLEVAKQSVISGFERYVLTNEMIKADAKEYISELGGHLVKSGNIVTFNGRVNISKAMTIGQFVEVFDIPAKFIPHSTGYWNTAVTINQVSTLEASRVAYLGQNLKLYSNKTGNHYLSASWYVSV